MERYGVCVCVDIHKEAILSKVPNAPPLQDVFVCVCVCVCVYVGERDWVYWDMFLEGERKAR